MNTQSQPTPRLMTCASDSRCQHCPPDRVCAWDCVQGAGFEDILIGAVLEQSDSWALRQPEPDEDSASQALMDAFNG